MQVQFDIGPVYVGKTERRIPYSLNKRLHWAARYRWNKAWKEAVEPGIWENKKNFGKLPIRYANVIITLHTMKYLDTDNAYTTVKGIVDALTEYGVIEDDRPDWIDLRVKQSKVSHRNEEKVTLMIERRTDEESLRDDIRSSTRPQASDDSSLTHYG